MKGSIMLIITAAIILTFLILTSKNSITGNLVHHEGSPEEITLGYCPTMQEKAIAFSKENDYKTRIFNSASEVLYALKNDKIDKAMVGRKAKEKEINPDIRKTVLKSGHTLASNKKNFIDHSRLASIEIHTYLPDETASDLIPAGSRTIYTNKTEVLRMISEGNIALISWDDWDDDFELIVVMNKNKKVREFRGVFLYEN